MRRGFLEAKEVDGKLRDDKLAADELSMIRLLCRGLDQKTLDEWAGEWGFDEPDDGKTIPHKVRVLIVSDS